MKKLTETQCWSVANALRTAADKFTANAAELREMVTEIGKPQHGGFASLARQFDDQAEQACRIAGYFENSDGATIHEGDE